MQDSESKQGQGDATVLVNEEDTSGPLASTFANRERRYPAFLGLSMKNRMSNRRVLEIVIPWLYARASVAKVIVGDYPHRHNLAVLNGCSPDDALQKTIKDGKRPLNTANAIVKEIGAESTITVCSSKDLIEADECRRIQHELTQYVDAGGPFEQDVLNDTLAYVDRVYSDLDKNKKYEASISLKEYIIEEIAMFLHLYSLGFPIEVYHGPDMPIMRKIAMSTYSDFPFACPQRTHVSIMTE